MSLYSDLIAAGVQVDNHESDLYFPATEKTRAILERYPLAFSIHETFINQRPPNVGERWIDVPFAFEPWWTKRQGLQRIA